MSLGDLQNLGLGTLTGLGASTVFILVLFIGFCVILGFPKLRPGSRRTRVIRSLEDLDGQQVYLPPDAPRGPADQLASPELREQSARNAS